MTNHYQTLGVTRDATPAMVKAAFQKKMKALQESGLLEAPKAAREKALQQAFVTLFDPAGKARYDKQLATTDAVQSAPPPHEVARTNPLVIVVAVAAIGGALAAGWYVTHPSADKQAQARKEAAARNKAARKPLELRQPAERETKK